MNAQESTYVDSDTDGPSTDRVTVIGTLYQGHATGVTMQETLDRLGSMMAGIVGIVVVHQMKDLVILRKVVRRRVVVWRVGLALQVAILRR